MSMVNRPLPKIFLNIEFAFHDPYTFELVAWLRIRSPMSWDLSKQTQHLDVLVLCDSKFQ